MIISVLQSRIFGSGRGFLASGGEILENLLSQFKLAFAPIHITDNFVTSLKVFLNTDSE